MKQKLMSPLSNHQLYAMVGCGEDDVIAYSKLRGFESIDELLPTDKSFKILLLEESRNRGHFTCLYRQDDLICYMNSYGDKPDRDLNCIPRMIRRMLGEDRAEIQRLCEGKTIWYNEKKLQGDKTQTCGRWCVAFIECLKMGHTPDQFLELIVAHKKKTDYKTFDEVVCSITN
jgi:hypothetical protein